MTAPDPGVLEMGDVNVMESYKIEATIEEDGSLTLRALPFAAGELVEVTVNSIARGQESPTRYPLRGTPYHYDDPTEPVATREWEAAR